MVSTPSYYPDWLTYRSIQSAMLTDGEGSYRVILETVNRMVWKSKDFESSRILLQPKDVQGALGALVRDLWDDFDGFPTRIRVMVRVWDAWEEVIACRLPMV